ncbi:hypothetical protein OROHE_006942 [Orobanche hederae]
MTNHGRPIEMLPGHFPVKEADGDLSSGEEAGDHCHEALHPIIDRCSVMQNIHQAENNPEPEAFDEFCEKGEPKISFKNWFLRRPDFSSNEWSEKLRTPHEFHHGDAVMEAIVKDRCGSVLGEGSKHKMYFFPGQRTSSYIQIYGAPHIFKVDGYPFYNMATPTIAGAKETLAYLPVVKGSIVERVTINEEVLCCGWM